MKRQSGQAIIIILLVMAVGLTIGLSIISRSITDIRISQQEEESARAFSAAEAGIEEALGQNLAAGESLSRSVGGIDYHVSATAQGSGRDFDFGAGQFDEGDIQTVWLIEHTNGDLGGPSFPANGTIAVCWGEEATPAIEVTIIYQSGGSFRVARGAYDPVGVRRTQNGFDPPEAGVDAAKCGDLDFEKDISLTGLGIPGTATLYALRLKLLYNDSPQPLRVWGSTNFPSQGKCFVSTATIPESGITRKVQQCQFHKAPPGIFDYVLFSEGDLTK